LGLALPDLPLTVPVWYIPLSGAVWGIGSLVVALGLLLGRAWAQRAVRWGTLLFVAWFWIDRLFLVVSDFALRTRAFSLAVSVVTAIIVFWVMSMRKVRRYFRELDG
jgi:hypothetical protein